MENINQEKYPQPSKKAKKIDCYGYGEHKTGKIPTAKPQSYKKIDCHGYGEHKTGKIPTAKQKSKKIDCCGYVRTEDRKNTHSQAKKIIEKRKQIKKKTRHIVI